MRTNDLSVRKKEKKLRFCTIKEESKNGRLWITVVVHNLTIIIAQNNKLNDIQEK